MGLPLASPISAPALITALPGWALPRGREPDDIGTAFVSGTTLKSMDDLVRTAPVWAGCWRVRHAFKCAAVAVRLTGCSQDEPALRDTVLLIVPGGDPGSVGKMFFA